MEVADESARQCDCVFRYLIDVEHHEFATLCVTTH